MPWRPIGEDTSMNEFCDNECPRQHPCESGEKLCTGNYHPWGCPRQDECVSKDKACNVGCPSGFLTCGGYIVS